ncbi:MAG: hypothetical protein E4H20_04785 [Spirochaetales bacterium]|nr:MAG: hypothetical protein E4H20_04785 [Spirochaetales bacterium]
MPTILIVCGERGVGKTTALAAAAQRLAAAGTNVGGVLCPGRYENGVKSVILWTDAAGGPQRSLARLATSISGQSGRPVLDASDHKLLRYGKWEFNREELRLADHVATDAIRLLAPPSGQVHTNTDPVTPRAVFIDEIGPLELDYGVGFTCTLAALDALASSFATLRDDKRSPAAIVAVRPELVPSLLARWPEALVLRIRIEDREETAGKISRLFENVDR